MDILRFLNYLRYRSFGLIVLSFILFFITFNFWFIFYLFLFIFHTYYIYRKEDKGTTHYIIIKKLEYIENQNLKNQKELIELIKQIKDKI